MFGEIDWASSRVLKGDGPCNAQRMERRAAHEEGAGSARPPPPTPPSRPRERADGSVSTDAQIAGDTGSGAAEGTGRPGDSALQAEGGHGAVPTAGVSTGGRRPGTPAPRPAKRRGRCGRSSSAPAAGCRTSTSAACTRRTPRWRCATPATSTPAAVRASDLGRSRRAITASSPDEKDAFFDPAAGQGLPPPDVLRHPRRGAPPVTGRPARQPRPERRARRPAWPPLRPRARGRRPGARPAAGRVDHPAPQLEEDVALANIALDLLGQARTLLTYAGEVEGAEGAGTRTTWRSCATSGNSRTCSSWSSRTATSPSPWRGAHLLELPARALPALAGSRRRHPRRDRRQGASRRSTTTATTPRAGSLRLGDGTEESPTRRMQAGLEQVWPYVDELFDGRWPPGLVGAARRRRRPGRAARRPWAAHSRTSSPRPRSSVPPVRPGARGGRRGYHTEATWATCSPRCSTCTAHTPERAGDHDREQLRDIAGSVTDPEIPVLTLHDLGILP